MAIRIIKNLTTNSELIPDLGVEIPAGGQLDLCESCSLEEIANSDDLIELLGQGVDKFVVSDGSRDYELGDGIDLVRRITQKFPVESISHAPRFAMLPPEGNEILIISHNWCDKCTWYEGSIKVIDETLQDSGDGLSFTSQHEYWIDLNHGRLSKEEYIKSEYLPIIKVDGIEKTERAAFLDSGGDFEINYENGTVTFFEVQTGVVTATYYYAQSSQFTIVPNSDKILRMERAEVQFAKNIEMNDSVCFELWAYNPEDLPNKIIATPPDVFKTVRDFIDDATGCYPEIPAFGGIKRGVSNPHIVFPFNYRTVRDLNPNQGLEVRIRLENDIPFDGEFATITFYCTEI